MTIEEAVKMRHSVRAYTNRPIAEDLVLQLRSMIDQINLESGLHIQLFTNEPKAFSVGRGSYGMFSNCKNYFAIAAQDDMDEMVGYYGEKLVLFAQQLGLNTCWVALTVNKKQIPVLLERGEKIQMVIALGYGVTQGRAHKSKAIKNYTEQMVNRRRGFFPAWNMRVWRQQQSTNSVSSLN